MELQSRYQALRRTGLELAVLTYDTSDIQRAYAERQGLEFPLLSDVGSETIKRYGILNRGVSEDSRTYGIPHPGTFIVDTNGRVVERFFEQTHQPRNTVASIAVKLGQSLDGTGVSGTRLTTDHLEVVAYPTDEIVAPGNRLSVVLDVTPKADMHVYAPGDHSYQVISLHLEPQEGLIMHPVTYPEPQIYHFEPLDERVEVYQEPFRLLQDVTIPRTDEIRRHAAAGASLTVHGVLAYQACDRSICYNPVELPVSWTFMLRPMVVD